MIVNKVTKDGFDVAGDVGKTCMKDSLKQVLQAFFSGLRA
ncbi:hypothetical protein I633_08760 [Alteromonas mediterranea 615]|uniref:Uncharacterized protein n=1 Tax=Alteromonas mediterranea 615 TaxID=1300253 RepID=S5AG86_9ALTE|nr:hypothetical protein I633_08760 [Alteromonas mediterranea 615]